MLSVNQMFYGTDEPVWLVDGSSPAPVKYHYLGSSNKTTIPPPIRSRDSYYDYESPISDPYYVSSRRGLYSPPRSRAARRPNYYNVSREVPLTKSVPLYSSNHPPPAPVVVPTETPITHTPVVPVVDSLVVPVNTPYTLLLKVPICCEGCERRVVKKLLNVPGVMSVRCDINRQKVTVQGTADTDEVLKAARKAFKKARLW